MLNHISELDTETGPQWSLPCTGRLARVSVWVKSGICSIADTSASFAGDFCDGRSVASELVPALSMAESATPVRKLNLVMARICVDTSFVSH